MRTAARLNIKTVAVYSEADAGLPFVREATESVLLGPASPAQSYLNIPAVLEAAAQTDAEAVHPGYGFLAENADFATAVLDAGLIWIGPSPDAIAQMGDKVKARNLMTHAGVPVMPGSTEAVVSVERALEQAAEIGYPVMVKAVAGGGGIGMGAARNAEELRSVFETARTRAERFFANPAVLLERFVTHARHVEVQILGLTDSRIVTLGERDCSVQRRHQKLVEETPSPGLSVEVRERMLAAATRAGEAVAYRSAGTVEFLVDLDRPGEFYFLEMNTRLQVEHPITELVTGIDLVEQQFLIASGEPVSFDPGQLTPTGHAIELRIYAEDPVRFLPGPGTISKWREPTGEGIRVDAGYTEGDTVTPFYDPLLAKLCAWGPDRDSALRRAASATAEFVVEGPKCNLPLFSRLLVNGQFVSGAYDTGLIADTPYRPV
jgi:acetyl-CoA carboxylase biotin carboxylase subunit